MHQVNASQTRNKSMMVQAGEVLRPRLAESMSPCVEMVTNNL
jgi:hypothetical protein